MPHKEAFVVAHGPENGIALVRAGDIMRMMVGKDSFGGARELVYLNNDMPRAKAWRPDTIEYLPFIKMGGDLSYVEARVGFSFRLGDL